MYTRDVISCFGQFGFVDAPHEFRFRAYPDGKLSVAMQRKSKCSGMAQNDFMTTQNTDEEALNNNRETTFAVINGLAKKHEESGEYDVKFIVVMSGAGMFCRGRLSAEGLVGTFHHFKGTTSIGLFEDCDEEFGSYGDSDEKQDEELAFELVAREGGFVTENIQDPLDVLTPGKYKFHGTEFNSNYTSSFNIVLELELRPDGTIMDMKDEFEKSVRLNGTWSPSGSISIYFENHALHNSWVGYDCGSMDLTSSIQMLRGEAFEPHDIYIPNYDWSIIDLELDSCRKRAWSKELHVQFPPEFRESVKWLLLSSLREHQDASRVSLPSAVWRHVLKFTSERWFS